ncbi:outer membrane beta-barrel protein [Edaphobacter aggregans]|uniref:outer membrane beta-barrel protein n=1 Tax=Edaphobacter aggregans TaxID=570835 RepID=UPI000550946E|nr:outer membrane beta-barrel protein [Edaphobacter aggregans]
MRRLFHIGSFSCLLWVARWSHGQAVPTAERTATVQIGAGWSVVSPDYAGKTTQGVSIYGTFDLTPHWGIEGDIHKASMITPSDIGESSYLLGPRYVFRHNRLRPYAKALFGLGRFQYQYDNVPDATYTYKIYAFGGGIDVVTTKHINLRAVDFEYQKWPGFPPNGLSPMVFTFGAAYAFR